MSDKAAKIFLTVFCAIVLVFVTAMTVLWWPHKPFADLQRENVAGITAHYTFFLPEEYAYEELPPEVVDEIVALMRDVTVYRRQDNLIEVTGAQNWQFTVHMTDGTSFAMSTDSGRLVIGAKRAWFADKKTSAAIDDIWSDLMQTAREAAGKTQ